VFVSYVKSLTVVTSVPKISSPLSSVVLSIRLPLIFAPFSTTLLGVTSSSFLASGAVSVTVILKLDSDVLSLSSFTLILIASTKSPLV